jgi:hypothetical protein
MSKPEGPGVIRASIVVVWHSGQVGRGKVIIGLAFDQAGAQHSQLMDTEGGAVIYFPHSAFMNGS